MFTDYPLLLAQRQGDEGWLDTVARLETERGLTSEEQAEADKAWAEFARFMAALASPSVTNSPEKTASGSTASRRRRKAGESSR